MRTNRARKAIALGTAWLLTSWLVVILPTPRMARGQGPNYLCYPSAAAGCADCNNGSVFCNVLPPPNQSWGNCFQVTGPSCSASSTYCGGRNYDCATKGLLGPGPPCNLTGRSCS